MAIEQYTNNAMTTLNGAITSTSSTSITVTDGSVFSSVGNFRIIIDDEIMLVTARSTNTLTVTRGVEGTTAATHLDTTNVTDVLTSQSLLNLLAEGIATGDFSARPSAGRPGRLYIPNDGLTIARDDGSVWTSFGPCWKFTPPSFSGGSWMNQNNALSVDEFDGIHQYDTGGQMTSDEFSFYHKAIPTPGSPWTLTAAFVPQYPDQGSGVNAGIGVGYSGNNNTYSIVTQCDGVHITGYGNVQEGSNGTPGTVVANNQPIKTFNGPCHFFKIQNDGTNITFWVSCDYRHWMKRFSVALGSSHVGTAPDWYGPYMNNFNTNSGQQMDLFFYELKLTQP